MNLTRTVGILLKASLIAFAFYKADKALPQSGVTNEVTHRNQVIPIGENLSKKPPNDLIFNFSVIAIVFSIICLFLHTFISRYFIVGVERLLSGLGLGCIYTLSYQSLLNLRKNISLKGWKAFDEVWWLVPIGIFVYTVSLTYLVAIWAGNWAGKTGLIYGVAFLAGQFLVAEAITRFNEAQNVA